MMSTTTREIATVLNSLIQVCRDGQQGFRAAAADVQQTACRELFTDLSAQRAQYADTLRRLVASYGESSEESGSVAGAVHRGWIAIKAAISGGHEHAILAECERGEDAAVEEYREALRHPGLPAEVQAVIREQSLGVKGAHDRIRALRDRTA